MCIWFCCRFLADHFHDIHIVNHVKNSWYAMCMGCFSISVNHTVQILSTMMRCIFHQFLSLIARFMRPTWGPSGADRTQVGPMLAPWTLLSGISLCNINHLKSCIVETCIEKDASNPIGWCIYILYCCFLFRSFNCYYFLSFRWVLIIENKRSSVWHLSHHWGIVTYYKKDERVPG